MATRISPGLLICISACLFNAVPSFADDFPGKGDRFAWGNALPYYNLANKYLEHGRYEDAIAKYEEAIYRYEYDPDFFINYGVALRKCENYTAAEQAFKKAIELRGNDWQAWSNLANSYLKQNRLKETIACFQKAMKMQPPPPPQERDAMLKDIADINKILSMQAPPPSAASTKGSLGSGASTKALSESAARAKASGSTKTAQATRAQSKHSQSSTGTKITESSAVQNSRTSENTGTEPSESNVGSSSNNQPPNKQELKKSGWDWVY